MERGANFAVYDFTTDKDIRTVKVSMDGRNYIMDRDQTLDNLLTWVMASGDGIVRGTKEQAIQTITLQENGVSVADLQYRLGDREMAIKVNRMERMIENKKKNKIKNVQIPSGVKKVAATIALGAVLTGGFIGGVHILGQAFDHNFEIQDNIRMEQQHYVPTQEEIEAGTLEYEQEQNIQGRQM